MELNEKNSDNQYTRTERHLAILYEISNTMRTTLELDHILHIILTGVTSHMGLGFNRAILFLYNPKERVLEPKMALGPESEKHAKEVWEYVSNTKQNLEDLIAENRATQSAKQSALFESIKNLKIPLTAHHHNVLSGAFHQGSSLHLKEKELNEYKNDPFLTKFKTNELIIMPLKAKDKVKGLIVADNFFSRKPITDDDLRIFTMLANQAGLAIENSELYEMIMQKSRTDSLTNVWNHGFFQNQFSDEIIRAQRHKEDLALIMLDIDNFKKLNDTFGHQAGDIVLQRIAEIIKESSREIDFVCRYGGEEFAVILPKTNQKQALNIAERIRQNITAEPISVSATKILNVTVSLGVAIFPANAATKEDVISKADKAMYIAKFSGKNQVCLADKK